MDELFSASMSFFRPVGPGVMGIERRWARVPEGIKGEYWRR